MAFEPIFLNAEQLPKLAQVIYNQEAQNIQNIQFDSEAELVKYLNECLSAYRKALKLLEDGTKLDREFENDKARASIAGDVLSFILNFGLQLIPNYILRESFLDKLGEVVNKLIVAVRKLDTSNSADVERLAEEAAENNQVMREYAIMYQSPLSKQFSQNLKDSRVTFEQLVITYQGKLNYTGRFNDLEDAQKVEVYNNKIIEESGRGTITAKRSVKSDISVGGAITAKRSVRPVKSDISVPGTITAKRSMRLVKSDISVGGTITAKRSVKSDISVGSVVMKFFTAGMVVWDIYSAENHFKAAAKIAIVEAAKIGGAMLGQVVGAVAAIEIVGVTASVGFIISAAIVGGVVGAFVVGAFVGWTFDLIFNSGGSAPLSTDNLVTYVAEMPDGQALARRIIAN